MVSVKDIALAAMLSKTSWFLLVELELTGLICAGK